MKNLKPIITHLPNGGKFIDCVTPVYNAFREIDKKIEEAEQRAKQKNTEVAQNPHGIDPE